MSSPHATSYLLRATCWLGVNCPCLACGVAEAARRRRPLTLNPARFAGSFNDWGPPISMRQISSGGDFVRSVVLPPGLVEYKFTIDGVWRHSPRFGSYPIAFLSVPLATSLAYSLSVAIFSDRKLRSARATCPYLLLTHACT